MFPLLSSQDIHAAGHFPKAVQQFCPHLNVELERGWEKLLVANPASQRPAMRGVHDVHHDAVDPDSNRHKQLLM